MSSTELHTGTLTPVKTINSHQEFMDFVHENELTGYLTSSIEIYLDDDDITDVTATNGYAPLLLCACQNWRGLPKYCFYKNVIYKLDNYTVEEGNYINEFNRNSDGSINFVSMFYNGGTVFYEELQEGLDKLLNNDRNYQVGDILNLNEIDENGVFTGNNCAVIVTHVLDDNQYLLTGYVILSFRMFYSGDLNKDINEIKAQGIREAVSNAVNMVLQHRTMAERDLTWQSYRDEILSYADRLKND